MRRWVLQSALLFVPIWAAAQQWESVASYDGAIELDRASVVSVETGFQAWSRQIHPKQVLGPEEGFFYRRLMQLNEYQCEKRMYAPLQRLFFNDNGLLVKEEHYSADDELIRVVPGTPESRIYTAVCRNFKNKKVRQAAADTVSPEKRVKTAVRNKNAISGQPLNAQATSAAAAAKKPASAQKTGLTVQITRAEAQNARQKNEGTSGILGFLNRLLPQPVGSSHASAVSGSETQENTIHPHRQSPFSDVIVIKPTPETSVHTTQIPRQAETPAVSKKQAPEQSAAPKVSEKQAGKADSSAVNVKPAVNTKSVDQSLSVAVNASKPVNNQSSASKVKPSKQPSAKPGESKSAVQKASEAISDVNLAAVSATGRPTENIPWLYELSSNKGPAKWAKLSSKNALCSEGIYQSPIDIRNPVLADMEPIQFSYRPMPLKITDTGVTVRVDVDAGAWLSWRGVRYDLLYYTFHQPSEIQVNGKTYDMAIHLIHRSVQGKVTVLAVPVKAGRENTMVRRIWNNLPLEMGVRVSPPNIVVNPAGLLPVAKGFYAFVGSLSTPPCTEGVLWLVLKTPVEMSAEQIADFQRLYKHNVRPIQPTRGRLVKETRY